MKPLLQITFLLLPALFCAQLTQEETDNVIQLKATIESAAHDTVVVQALMDWDDIIYVADPDLDLTLNKRIDSLCDVNLSHNLSDQEAGFFVRSKSFALNNIGLIYKHQGDFDNAINYYEKALELSESVDDNEGIAKSYNNIANICRNQGNYAKAIDLYMKALKINEAIDNKVGMAICLNNIGILYEFQKDLDKAIEYYTASLKIEEERANKKGIAASLGNIGNIYKDKKELDLALDYMMKSLAIKQEIGNKSGEAITMINVGNVYKSLNNFDKAVEYYNKSLILNQELNNQQGIAMCLNNIGVIHLKLDEFEQAQEYCLGSLEIAQELGIIIETQNASKSLWEIYKELGKPAEALKMHELFIKSRDSVLSIKNHKEVINQAYKYSYA